LLAVLVLWQLAAVLAVDVEYYDGLETLQNARALLGDPVSFSRARWPVLVLIALPGEALRAALGLHPLDFRLAHLGSGLAHIAFLIAVYRLLVLGCGQSWATLTAFAAAIPTYMFFSQAPFLSNDVAPGALLIGMVLLSYRQLEAPRPSRWAWLIGLGAIAALTKPIYGVFWLAVVFAHALAAAFERGSERQRRLRLTAELLGAAAASGLLYWFVSAAVLAREPSGVAWWLEPYAQLRVLTSATAASEQPPWWLYLRNLPAHGLGVALGIAPGLVIALRAGGLARIVALVWLTAALCMQSFASREVRYVLFLAPLSAFLLVDPLARVWRRGTAAQVAIVAALLLTLLPAFPYSPLRAAVRIASPALRSGELRAFLAPLRHGEKRRRPLAWSGLPLTFTARAPNPLAGDRYHLLFHFRPKQLQLLGYRADEIRTYPSESIRDLTRLPGNILWSNASILRNQFSWAGGSPPELERSRYWLGRVVDVELRQRSARRYVTNDGGEIEVQIAPEAPGEVSLEISRSSPQLDRVRATWLLLPARDGGPASLHSLSDPSRFRFLCTACKDAPQRSRVGELSAWPRFAPGTRLQLRGLQLESEVSLGETW
jgi:hypothetical protein